MWLPLSESDAQKWNTNFQILLETPLTQWNTTLIDNEKKALLEPFESGRVILKMTDIRPIFQKTYNNLPKE